jgi:hypothetical protein
MPHDPAWTLTATAAWTWSGIVDRRVDYKIARREAMECAASLDVLKLRKLVG